MAWGARGYFVASVSVGVLAVLAGCTGGFFFAEREPWRHDAEVECLNSGLVKEGEGIVRMSTIRGPGVCGADYPLKVSVLGERMPLAFADDPRPPGTIPQGAAPKRWPINRAKDGSTMQEPPAPPAERSRYDGPAVLDGPISLTPPGVAESPAARSGSYDFRRPYGVTASPLPPPNRSASPRNDLSPVPYERRRLVDSDGNEREDWQSEHRRPPESASAVPDASSSGEQMTGSITPVAVNPPATLACPIVSELERWIATAVQPSAMHWFGAPVAEIKQISAYSCRGMNGNPHARISEHAFGNALDIAAFVLVDGRTITVKNGWHGLPEEQGFLRDVQGAACQQFTTVLAPGSNAYHYDHIHVDLMRRSSGYHTCNPHAVSGEEVAARAGGRYAARGHGPYVTGSTRGAVRVSKRMRVDPNDFPDSALPMAEPGNDGED